MRVNPGILSWARATAGLDLVNAAAKMGFRDGRNRTAEERLIALENGMDEPTRPVLLKMATVYRRPLLSFFLAAPPIQATRIEDFRTLPQEKRNDSAAEVDALVRDIRARQDQVRGLLEEENAPRVAAVAASHSDDGVPAIARRLGEWLQFDLAAFRRERALEASFSNLRTAAERAGVFVLLLGRFGPDHSAIDPEAFRGFALADPIAPFVVINDQDAKVAWSFTLLHELAHIAIDASGISGGTPEGLVEALCNDVAGEMLLPRAELELLPVAVDDDVFWRDITEFAVQRNVSRQMVANRLGLIGRLEHFRWREMSRAFREASIRGDEHGARDRGGDEASYRKLHRHQVGMALLQLVRRNLDEGNLTPTRAAKILGIKARSVEPLFAGQGSDA